jgi:hypothetical protein
VTTRDRINENLVPLTWIEHVASPLPRECSTTELQGLLETIYARSGAGEGNRTLVVSLEGFCSTIELHPHTTRTIRITLHCMHRCPQRENLVEGEGFEPSKAEPSDLQSDPVDRLGTTPGDKPRTIVPLRNDVKLDKQTPAARLDPALLWFAASLPAVRP